MNGTPDELVNYYKKDVFEDIGWKSESRKMVSEGTNEWRYDLIFASKSKTAVNIIDDIFDSDLKNDVLNEISDWRSKSDIDQSGLNTWITIDDHKENEEDDQSRLFEF